MPMYFSRAELQLQNEELTRLHVAAQRQVQSARNGVIAANREIKLLQEDLGNERNRNASLSRTVLRQQREIARLQAEVARLDEIAAPHIAKALVKKAG